MAYVLRPHKGNDNLDGWDDSVKYDKTAIKSIEDPNGGAASIPITSIPSPFASMELVRNAFEYCADRNNSVDGTSVYHKLVSFALDILEIFYNYDKYAKDLDIIPWYNNDLDMLRNSSDDDIKRLGDTLALYMDEDSDTFHFDKMDAIYMLNYKHGAEPINIIGGTSPTSLTIASTNNLDFVRIFLGNDHRALSSDEDTFCSLRHRDPDFIKFVWTMSLQPNFADIYPEVNKYIQRCFERLDNTSLKSELRDISASAYNNYTSLTFDAQTTIYLAGDIAMKVRQGADLSKSDFRIQLSNGKSLSEEVPLVLPYSTYTEPNMKYVSGNWNSDNKAPFIVKDTRGNVVPLNQRLLPFDGTQYPYLTVDDIFQPSIIETVYPISGNSFFTANFKDSNKGNLLPLKQTLFEYMSLEDLRGVTNEPSPRPIFEISSKNENVVKVSLRIPIQKGKYIAFERNYFRGQDPNPEQNKGCIVECKFNLYLFPSYHIGIDSPQRIYVVDQDKGALTQNYRYEISAFKEDNQTKLQSHFVSRADKSKGGYTSFYNALNKEFDYLKISNGRYENVIIPLYEDKSGGTRAFDFAVDFGTTNTHIEYSENGNNPKPLEINASNPFILKLSNYSFDSEEDKDKLYDKAAEFLLQTVPQEFIPEAIGRAEDFSFPMRTNLSKLRSAKTGQRELISLADYTIAFGYEKTVIHTHNEVLTDLKWNRNNNDAVKAYIEELLLLIRSTVLIGGGDLAKTTIKWFYPVSMSPYLKSRLETAWNTMCKDLISPSCTIMPISESIAPYYYYKDEQGVNSSTCSVVSVDVGGGTSDFVTYQNNTPKFISSVRFAGNNLFGDFYGMSSSLNGFYKQYKDLFKKKINESSQKSELGHILEDILANNNSADLVSFLFSLENNAALKKKGEKISLSSELQENYQMKVVFLLFYTAIIYYIAQLLNKKGIPSPRYITCSGTASKIFNIIGGTDNIQKFTNLIFNEVQKSETKLILKQDPNPKEITCKGGLKMSQEDIDATPSKAYFFGTSILDGKESILAEELENLPADIVNEVIENYKEFIKFFFKLNEKMSFAQYFGIEDNGAFAKYEEVLIEDAEQDFATVLGERLKDFQQKDSFEDSLFFYPLSGGIFRLAAFIS